MDNSGVVIGGGYWLDDGDTIPNMQQSLSDGQLSLPTVSMLMGGTCRKCEASYYVVETTFLYTPEVLEEQGDALMLDWLAGELESTCSTNFTAGMKGKRRTWLVTRDDTHIGHAFTHVHGPFSVPTNNVLKGPHGISACGSMGAQSAWSDARSLLLQHWDEMMSINDQLAIESSPGASNAPPPFMSAGTTL